MAALGAPGRGRIIAAETEPRVSLRRNPWLLWAFAVCVIALFARLGAWQLARADEKRAMLHKAGRALQQRRSQPFSVLVDATRVGEYDWVELRGRFADAPAVLLDNQQRAGKVGVRAYRVFLPEALASEQSAVAVLVDLGWVPLPGDRAMPQVPLDAQRDRVAGLLLPPPGRGLDVGPPSAQANGDLLATAIDPPALGRALRMPMLSARVLRPLPETGFGFERDFDILPNTLPPERHLGYAVQWFALSAAVLITALLLTWRRRRRIAVKAKL
jgi:surfeit locus 1 family protein